MEHPRLFTVEEGRPWHDKIPGLHCKNLIIKDRMGCIWLVVMLVDKIWDGLRRPWAHPASRSAGRRRLTELQLPVALC